ncbi:hypothetical protein DOV67_26080 [Salmonella enterica subsp. enterica serovar Java]|uniref:Uncharacterized protein n=5 Tax=Salmonella enterica TaxID=28901 RepID=A0A3R0UBT0_SALER|nr:hypothetical protein [Salmonella enterica subsp. enterica serovar Java]EAO1480930.1 hypothetical protein [Salmonella enterica]ECA3791098.1 hypothetical protein [Salmonella enterica subsp. enterica serovar Aqua]ECD7244806.1 hypothetical protein [Salmonella enterica subsp. enterica serovar Florida]OSD65464.1 hypothetical protein R537_22900 [Salmonella enterica subsp. enterica serovar Rough O:d:1,7]
MLSKTGFTHSDLLCWQIDYAGGSLNVNGTIMWYAYNTNALAVKIYCYASSNPFIVDLTI